MLVKLQPYRQSIVAHRVNTKLCKHFFDPFPMMAKVGPEAYTLQLPLTRRIYPTFHVSQLKLFKGPLPPTLKMLPDLSIHNCPLLLPVSILATRIYSLRSRPVKQVLVHWSYSPPKDATWENFSEFYKLYQIMDLEDKVSFEGGGSVSYMDIGLDSEGVKKLMEVWADKGMVNQEEAQNSQMEAQNNSAVVSCASDQMEEIVAKRRIRASSRTSKKPTQMDDYV